MAQACERYGWHPSAALWGVPASLLLLLLRQPGPRRGIDGFGTAEKEVFDAVDLSDFD